MNLKDLKKLTAVLPTLKAILRDILTAEGNHKAGKITDAELAAQVHDATYKLKMVAGQQGIRIDEVLR